MDIGGVLGTRLLPTFRTRRSLLGRISPTEPFITAACAVDSSNGFTWDHVQGSWRISVNVEGFIIETRRSVSNPLPFSLFFPRDLPARSVEPGLPFASNHRSVSGQVADGLFSRMDIPRAHMTGYMVLPSGHNITLDRGIGTLKHTWSHRPMADRLSAYVRGTGFISDPPATVNWYQAWDLPGNGMYDLSLPWHVFSTRVAEIDSMQLLQPGGPPGSQVSRIQITDDPEILNIVTTPTPTSLPLSHNNTEITLPMCGPGADFENTDRKMTWKVTGDRDLFEFVDSAGGVTLCGMGHSTTVLWVNGTSQESSNGRGFIEVYRRG